MRDPIDAVGPVLLAALVIGLAGGAYFRSIEFAQAMIYAGCALGAGLLFWQQLRWGWHR